MSLHANLSQIARTIVYVGATRSTRGVGIYVNTLYNPRVTPSLLPRARQVRTHPEVKYNREGFSKCLERAGCVLERLKVGGHFEAVVLRWSTAARHLLMYGAFGFEFESRSRFLTLDSGSFLPVIDHRASLESRPAFIPVSTWRISCNGWKQGVPVQSVSSVFLKYRPRLILP